MYFPSLSIRSGRDPLDYADLHGLLAETPRKNSEAIADVIEGANVQDLQNFIADSKWDHSDVFAHVAGRANDRLGNHRDTTLILDESGFSKKGGAL